MPSVDDIIAHSFEDSWKGIEDQLTALEEAGFGERREKVYIQCTSYEDDDYEIAESMGCNAEIDISNRTDQERVFCECGREIFLKQKTMRSTYKFETDIDSIRDALRDHIKQVTNQSSCQKQEKLSYLGFNFRDLVLRLELNLLREGNHIEDTVDIHLCPERLPHQVAKTIKLYGKQSCFILVGAGTNNAEQFTELNLPFVKYGDLFEAENEEFEELIWDILDQARKIDSLTDIEQRARIAEHLYSNHRSERDGLDAIDEDEFEYIVNTLLNYCFKTSEMFGTTMSGSEVPDGVLCLQEGSNGPHAYLWDAKYSEPDSEPYNFPAADQRNMTKYPEIIYEHAGMDEKGEDIKHFEGFLFITPRLKTNDLINFAKKLTNRYSGDTIILSRVAHIRADALIEFYKGIRSNTHGTRRVRTQTHKKFNSLLIENKHHKKETEFIEYNQRTHDDEIDPKDWPWVGPSGIGIFDLTTQDVDFLFNELIKTKSPPETEPDYEHLRNMLPKADM